MVEEGVFIRNIVYIYVRTYLFISSCLFSTPALVLSFHQTSLSFLCLGITPLDVMADHHILLVSLPPVSRIQLLSILPSSSSPSSSSSARPLPTFAYPLSRRTAFLFLFNRSARFFSSLCPFSSSRFLLALFPGTPYPKTNDRVNLWSRYLWAAFSFSSTPGTKFGKLPHNDDIHRGKFD